MRQLVPLCLFCALVLGACGPAAEDSAAPLPTAAPPKSAPTLEDAALVARAFLDAWQAQNFAAMHRLLTDRLRETTSLAELERRYLSAQQAMGLARLDYQAEALFALDERVLAFQHRMTFHTRNLGSIIDENRRLHLALDADGWRVAWSPADIFAEMGAGARLVFEPQLPSRANIYDRNGKALADQQGRMARVWVNNAQIPQREACFEILAQTLDSSVDEMRHLFDVRSGADWRVLAGLMQPQVYIKYSDRVTAVCGAYFEQQATRRYVKGSLMPQLLGHVGYPDADQIPDLQAIGFAADSIIGKGGVEASWNATLMGKPGGRLSLFSSNGVRLRVLAQVDSAIPQSLWLTVDSDLQAYIARLLAEAFRDSAWGKISYGAAAIVMNVNNGEILAMVSYPTYDGNALNPFPVIGRETADKTLERLRQDERRPQLNRVAQGVYPTGSVMKGLSAIAALEAGVFDEDTRYYCSGSWTYGFDTRYDWLPGGHGSMTVSSGLTHSCNPAFFEVGFRLNEKDPWLLPSFARRFGLGELSGADAFPEVTGSVPHARHGLPTHGFALVLRFCREPVDRPGRGAGHALADDAAVRGSGEWRLLVETASGAGNRLARPTDIGGAARGHARYWRLAEQFGDRARRPLRRHWQSGRHGLASIRGFAAAGYRRLRQDGHGTSAGRRRAAAQLVRGVRAGERPAGGGADDGGERGRGLGGGGAPDARHPGVLLLRRILIRRSKAEGERFGDELALHATDIAVDV